MYRLLGTIQITVNEKLYIKNPESSDLGKCIVDHGILMINDMGNPVFNRLNLRLHV